MGYVTSNGLGDLNVRRRVVVGRRPMRGGYVTDAQLADLGWNPFKAVGKVVKKVAGVGKKLLKPALIIGAATFIPGVGPIVGKVAGSALKLGAGAVKGGIRLGIGGAKALLRSKTAVTPMFMPGLPVPIDAVTPAPSPLISTLLPAVVKAVTQSAPDPPPMSPALTVALQQAAAAPAPVYEPRSTAPTPIAVDAPQPTGELPGWVIPAAIGAGALLLLNSKRRG